MLQSVTVRNRGTRHRRMLTLLIWVMGSVSPAFAVNETQKLTAADAAFADLFGSAVAISGNAAIIGAPADDDDGNLSGSAYIFRFTGDNWVQEEKLTASDGAANAEFGTSVAISGDVVAIGAIQDAGFFGSAYVFRYVGESWVEEAKLTASDGAAGDNFGVSIGVSGDVVVAGAWLASAPGPQSGAAYVYSYDGSSWNESAKLVPLDSAVGDNFGISVSVSGDVAVIGAEGDDDDGNASGSAYVYRYNGASWVEEAKLTASDAAAEDQFGTAVAVSDELIVVGADQVDEVPVVVSNSGAAYVFRFDGVDWEEEAKLTASDAEQGDLFGFAVAASADTNTVVVGSPRDSSSAGSAYVFGFDRVQWMENSKLEASDAAAYDEFGFSVGVSTDTAVMGAHWDDDAGELSGSAYIFFAPEPSSVLLLGVGIPTVAWMKRVRRRATFPR